MCQYSLYIGNSNVCLFVCFIGVQFAHQVPPPPSARQPVTSNVFTPELLGTFNHLRPVTILI